MLLSPEMKSTGEVMGISSSFEASFVKSQAAAKNALPSSGKVFISLADHDKDTGVKLANTLNALGFEILATSGTYAHFNKNGVKAQMVYISRANSA